MPAITRPGNLNPNEKENFRENEAIARAIRQYVIDITLHPSLQENIGLSPEAATFLKKALTPLADGSIPCAERQQRLKTEMDTRTLLITSWIGGIADLVWPGKTQQAIVQEIGASGEALTQLTDYLDQNIDNAILGLIETLAEVAPVV